ncbi:hypothetical protein CTAYLR_009000 [Chrysophaeum taylorii]|uniref:Uncharacterized protein n=1 Tax=Chrysophaeum taylorii TaxID=2483200 RepID=A0AAD7XPA4_9STRA|nr:hypothetical protein CTAYLR_009000 [Chrysophaeum taylorii]
MSAVQQVPAARDNLIWEEEAETLRTTTKKKPAPPQKNGPLSSRKLFGDIDTNATTRGAATTPFAGLKAKSAQSIPKAPQDATKSGTAAAPRRIFGELENGTVRKTTGKAAATPATQRKEAAKVRFDVVPSEGGTETTVPAKAKEEDWRLNDDEPIEKPAGRLYEEQKAYMRRLQELAEEREAQAAAQDPVYEFSTEDHLKGVITFDMAEEWLKNPPVDVPTEEDEIAERMRDLGPPICEDPLLFTLDDD